MFPVARGQAREHAQHVEVALDLLLHARAQQLDDDLLAARQLRSVHLRDRRGGKWLDVKALEYLVERLFVGGLENLDGLLAWKRRYLVLQLGKLVGDVRGQQVAARRDRLAELDEDRPEFLEREANALAERRGRITAPRQHVEHEPQRPQQVGFLDDLVEAVLHEYPLDTQDAANCLAAAHGQRFSSRLTRASSRATSSRRASTPLPKRSRSNS